MTKEELLELKRKILSMSEEEQNELFKMDKEENQIEKETINNSRREVTNEELLRTARGFMKSAPKHSSLVELTFTTHTPHADSLYNAETAIDQRRLTWGKNK